MYKKLFVSSMVLIVAAALGAGIYRSTQASSTLFDTGKQFEVDSQSGILDLEDGINSILSTQPEQSFQDEQLLTVDYQLLTTAELSELEIEGILFMREEEKLARDVYAMLYSAWNIPIFQNISASEQAHMDALKVLIDRYNLSDSALAAPGTFSNPDLQSLYDELVVRGSLSLAEALKVGAAIEEIDILDLQMHLAQTDNPDIQKVYNNLLRGSQNHLRAFAKTLLTQTGETYQPQYLSLEENQAIISQSLNGGGNGRGGQGGWGGLGRGGGMQ